MEVGDINQSTFGPNLENLGACPTKEHSVTYPQCGFAGCVDLRVWAKANRYRFRLEESYKAENDAHVKGDGRWYVEILCRYGLIYPFGGTTLLAYASRGIKRHIAALGPDVQHYQTDGDDEVFKFPVERLDEVATILKPKRLPGRAEPTPEQREILRKHAFQGGQEPPETAPEGGNGERPG